MEQYEETRIGTLRCGVCFRNLATKPGQEMHDVFDDGSMRCRAPEDEGGSKIDPQGRGYTSTHVVLESAERRSRLHEVANFDVMRGRRANA